MGLLSLGTPLSWSDVSKYADHVREHGIAQLLATLRKYGDRRGDELLWGDEVEFMVVKFGEGRATLSLRQQEILDRLMAVDPAANASFHQEYGRYMVEATPARPFNHTFADMARVEPNMAARRRIARAHMAPDERPLTVTSYPLLGVGQFSESTEPTQGPATQSLFLPDNIINLHLRFPMLSANIRERRGKKVEIEVPVFRDTNTPHPWTDPLTTDASAAPRPAGVAPDTIYMDAMGFGMGCCCLQLTFQGSSIAEARSMYDALAPLTPLMLALSAASPIYRGVLADQDVRWSVVSSSVDDRTDDEKRRIPKSRYDSIDCYISGTDPVLNANPAFYNDVRVVTNPKVTKQLEDGGLANDPLLVQHFSHLFIRDPLVIFEELIDQNDDESTDHFENIQSTNWQTMRFKPPPSPDIGWRVEFRPMEVQITDFENAAFAVFIVLMSRVVLSLKLCFYTPISKVDANMRTAHLRDPVNRGKFWFRTNVSGQTADSEPGLALLTLHEIFNGGPQFKGLLPYIREYLAFVNVDMDTLCTLETYLTLLSRRASGALKTNAQWIREFVQNHADYKHDSIITDKINYDLMREIDRITDGEDWNTVARSMLGGCASRVAPPGHEAPPENAREPAQPENGAKRSSEAEGPNGSQLQNGTQR